jgi:hypothetical protein
MTTFPVLTACICAGGLAAFSSRDSASVVTSLLGAGGVGISDGPPLWARAPALSVGAINSNCACRPSRIVRILFKASLNVRLVCSSAARRSVIRTLTRRVVESPAGPQSLISVSRRSADTDDVCVTGDEKDSKCCGWCAAAVGSGGRRSSFCYIVSLDRPAERAASGKLTVDTFSGDKCGSSIRSV